MNAFLRNQKGIIHLKPVRVRTLANRWIENNTRGARSTRDTENPGRGRAIEYDLEVGMIVITVPTVTSDNRLDVIVQTANIHVETASFTLLNNILTNSSTPYWDFVWHVKGRYEISPLVGLIEGSTEHHPYSSGPTDAHFKIAEIEGIVVTTWLTPTSMSMTCTVKGINQGFHTTHRILSPTKIISFLLGEISYSQIQAELQKSLKH